MPENTFNVLVEAICWFMVYMQINCCLIVQVFDGAKMLEHYWRWAPVYVASMPLFMGWLILGEPLAAYGSLLEAL